MQLDFSKYPRGNVNYGGSERKESICIPNADGTFSDYMVKFQKLDEFGRRNNHISEYIGSHVFESLGFNTQETYLGTFDGEQVVACKSFVNDDELFVPFNDVGESTLDEDKESYQYEYEDIMRMLRDNSKLTDVSQTISHFWEIYIVDALLGNFDRHGYNWGFIKKNNTYKLAPVFDNGSCLFPNMTEHDMMEKVINSREETEKRIHTFPTSQIKLNGQKSSYYDVISSLEFDECNAALREIMERIDMGRVHEVVGSVPNLADVHYEFYIHMLDARYREILEQPWLDLVRSHR